MVADLLKKADFICLQEHWLWSFEAENIIKESFPEVGLHIRSIDEYNNIVPLAVGRGHGGVCTLWNSEHDPYVKKTKDGNERILVTLVEYPNNSKICLVNCYLPSGDSKKAQEDLRMT